MNDGKTYCLFTIKQRPKKKNHSYCGVLFESGGFSDTAEEHIKVGSFF